MAQGFEAMVTPRPSTRRTRVLHLVQNLNYGGMERLIADLVQRTDPARFECHVLVLQYMGRFSEGLDAHATLHLAEPLPRHSIVWPEPLARQIRRIAPDVVHSHSGVWLKASHAARRARVGLVVHTEHGRRHPDPWDDRLVDRVAARRTDVVVAVSDVLAHQLRRTVVGRRTRVVVVPNGVDTDAYRPASGNSRLHAELGLHPQAPLVGTVGRLEPIKGYDIMVEAFARLSSEWTAGPPPALVMVGDGSERERLQRQAGRLGVSGRIHFLGWRDDIQRILPECTLFSLSSRSEGTSVSLLEAMSSGLCPVVTDVGGNAAVLGEGLAHRLVAPANPAALASAWIAALRDEAGRASDGRAARARVTGRFALQGMVRDYESIYSGVLPTAAGERRAPGRTPERSPGALSAVAGEL